MIKTITFQATELELEAITQVIKRMGMSEYIALSTSEKEAYEAKFGFFSLYSVLIDKGY